MPARAPKRLSSGRRAALLIWLVLAAAYGSTVGMDAAGGHDYAGDESHYLLAARSLAEHQNLDIEDDYRDQGWRDFDTAPPKPQGVVRAGARYEPHAIGLPLLAAPFYALGGARAVELMIAALLATAMSLSYLLARRVVPDPWCGYAALAVGLSPPLIAHGTAVVPEPAAAAALAGAALCAARLRDRLSRRTATACFALLGSLPWFGLVFVPPGLVIAWAAIRSLRRAGRGLLALASTEVAFFSIALLVGLNEALFRGPTPHSADVAGTSATGVDSLPDYFGRCWRIVALFLDRDYGLLRWAPVAALIFVGVWVLYRSQRERLVRAIAGLDEELGLARLCGAAALATVLTAAVLLPSLGRYGFPGRPLIPAIPLLVPVVALGLRQSPRIGLVLALLGIAGSAWLWVDARSGGGLLADRPSAPWGPLVDVFPKLHGGAWAYVLLATVVAALAAPVIRKEIEVRHRLG